MDPDEINGVFGLHGRPPVSPTSPLYTVKQSRPTLITQMPPPQLNPPSAISSPSSIYSQSDCYVSSHAGGDVCSPSIYSQSDSNLRLRGSEDFGSVSIYSQSDGHVRSRASEDLCSSSIYSRSDDKPPSHASEDLCSPSVYSKANDNPRSQAGDDFCSHSDLLNWEAMECDEGHFVRGRLLEKMIRYQRPDKPRSISRTQISGKHLRKLVLVDQETERRKKIEEERLVEASRKVEKQRQAGIKTPPGDKVRKGLKTLVLSERIAEEKRYEGMQHRLGEHGAPRPTTPVNAQDQDTIEFTPSPSSKSGRFIFTAECSPKANLRRIIVKEHSPQFGQFSPAYADRPSYLLRPSCPKINPPSRIPRLSQR